MSSLAGYYGNVTGTTGSTNVLEPKGTWYVYVLPRGAHASASSSGTKITFDSADAASRFTANQWVQVGLSGANVRQVSSVGGTSILVNSAVTVAENDRVYLIGSTQPTISGASATYQPGTTIYPRDDNGATPVTSSLLTTDSNGLFQFWAGRGTYDLIGQDTNRTNQFSVIDAVVGTGSAVEQTGIVNVKDYGAIGNGTADDTSAIRSALLACGATGTAYASLYFPPGRYYITGGLTSNANGLKIEGAGGPGHNSLAVSLVESDQAITMFTFNQDGVSPPGTIAASNGMVMRDIGWRDSSTAGNQVATGLRLHSAKHYHLENVSVGRMGAGVGIVIGDTRDYVNYGMMLNCNVDDCLVGVSTVSPSGARVNGIKIIGGVWGHLGGGVSHTGIKIGAGCDTWVIDGVNMHDYSKFIYLHNAYSCVLSPRMEMNTSSGTKQGIGIELDGDDSSFCRNNTIIYPLITNLATGISIGPTHVGTNVLWPRTQDNTTIIVDGGTATNIISQVDYSETTDSPAVKLGYRRVTQDNKDFRITTVSEVNYGQHPAIITGQSSGLLVRDSLTGYSGGLYLGASSVNYGMVGTGSIRDHSSSSYRANGVSASQIVLTDGRFDFYANVALTPHSNYTPTRRASLDSASGLAVDGALGVTGTATLSGQVLTGLTLTASRPIVLSGTTLCVFGISTLGGTSLHVNDTVQSTLGFQIGDFQILIGAGAPSAAVPNGSVYWRTDGTISAGTAFYHREGGSWVNS